MVGQVDGSAPGGANGNNGQAQQGGLQSLLSTVLRLGFFYALFMYMRGGKEQRNISNLGLNFAEERIVILPYFRQGDIFNMQVYLSTSPDSGDKLIWTENEIPIADKLVDRKRAVTILKDDLAPVLESNKTLYLVTRFALNGTPGTPLRIKGAAFLKATPLFEFRPEQKDEEGRSLLSGRDEPSHDVQVENPVREAADDFISDDESTVSSDETAEVPWFPFMKQNVTISMINMFEKHSLKSLPEYMHGELDYSETDWGYNPVIHYNEFWRLKDHFTALNNTVESVQLNLNLNTISKIYWTLMLAMKQSYDIQKANGMISDKQLNELKSVFIEGNPYFLALTMLVSLLHSVFDMLAFKNDIGFWKSNKSMEGLSAKTVIINAFCQLIIFLYLLDNETSLVVLFSAGIGFLIELWKITRVVNITVEKTDAGRPRIKFAYRGSYVNSDTKKWDDEATRYMGYGLTPCIIGYFVYSLIYEKHRGWYSFIIQTLVGCVYAFGFVLMCPQLYLNYKLKSVAHLPWRQMTYKFLNTIIDDLFAFVIKMPFLHRLSVFRDDAVFLVYLYQRWIYRVDKSRVNEFGFSEEKSEEDQIEPSVAEIDAPATHTSEDAAGNSSSVRDTTRRRGQAQQPQPAGEIADETPKDK